MSRGRGRAQYVMCVSNKGYPTSLLVRRVYRQLPDAEAEGRGLLRVIDESGEDYLFPRALFAAVSLPAAVTRKLVPIS